MFNMQNLMKQAQKMQKEMEQVQEELAKQEVTSSSGGGAVTVVCDGKGAVKSVKITEAGMEDRETLEELIVLAIQDASAKANKLSQDRMGGITKGLNLPGMPF